MRVFSIDGNFSCVTNDTVDIVNSLYGSVQIHDTKIILWNLGIYTYTLYSPYPCDKSYHINGHE